MNNKSLTNVALRYRAVFLGINREDIDMASEASVPVLAFVARLKENGFGVSEELLHALNAVSVDRLAEITESVNDVMDTYDTGAYGKNYIEDVFPTTFYRIKFRNISYYFLDSADGTFGYKQLNSLENLFISDSNKKIICTHYPLYADTLYYRLSNYKEKAHLINLLSNNDVILYLSGHTHIFFEHNFGSFKEYVCGNLVGDDEEPSFLILSFNKKGEYRNTRIEL